MTIHKDSYPTVAIVGRPNVGKSSLFNAIVGRRLSIVHEMPGVTRDRVIAPAMYRGTHFQLIDTGGVGSIQGEAKRIGEWDEQIENQVEAGIESADVLLFVMNVQDGITTLDEALLKRFRASGRPVLAIANKCDNPELVRDSDEFLSMGISAIHPVSCMHRNGIDAMLDALMVQLPEQPETAEQSEDEEKQDDDVFRIAVVGRPNVGKSSLVNALLGEERVIVSDVAGTTRDAIDIDFMLRFRGEDRKAVLVDTAGLRRKGKVDTVVEFFSVMRAQKSVERADLVLFVIEADPAGVTAQDKRIAALVQESGKASVLVANKFDLQQDEHSAKQLLKELRATLPGMSYAPAVFVSAKEQYNMDGLLDRIAEVRENMEIKIPTGTVNRVLADIFVKRTPPVVGNGVLKLYYASMISSTPPKFLLFVNNPKYGAANYLVYLKNCLRQSFDFTGLPIILELRARPKKVVSFHTEGRASKRPPKKKR